MKKVIFIMLVLALILLVGCKKELVVSDAPSMATDMVDGPTGDPEADAINQDIGAVDDGLSDIDLTALDSLEDDLNFDI